MMREAEYEITMIDFFDASIVRGGYDALCKVLELEFAEGGIYRYFDVPEELWYGLRRAESMSLYLRQCIAGQFRVQKRLSHIFENGSK